MRRSRIIKRARDLTRTDLALVTYTAACLLLGGASAAGAVANALLQLAAIAVLATLALRPAPPNADPPSQLLRALLGGLCLLCAAQFLPLPPAVWGVLPGRAAILDSYRLMGISPPWLPLSLAPDRAIGSVLALLPFAATLLLSMRASTEGRVAFAWTAIAVASLSIAVGAIQLFSGGASKLYFYTVTNRHDAVGFFANKNHLATLFLMTLPFIAALAAREEQSERRRKAARWPLYIGSFAFITFGAILNNSSAGLALLLPCIGVSFAIYRRGIGRPVSRLVVAGGVTLMLAGLLFVSVGPFHGRFLDKAISTNNSATRGTSIGLTVKAAREFMPFGSGLGSFRHIYTGYEDIATVTRDYVNHAHSDWAEVALETGAPGLILLFSLCVWLFRRAWTLWSGDAVTGSLARAGLGSLVLLLLHSLVDYPARTAAILCLAGAAAGMIALPRPASRRRARGVDPEENEAVPASRVFVAH